MKAVILAGGLGTRIAEETALKPKPMVEIGGKPILWHIMKIYSAYGIDDFIICCGYKGYVIKEYFANYSLHSSNVTFDMKNNIIETHQNFSEDWRITLVDTGHDTATAGRLKRVRAFIGDEDFCFTYGDGVSNVNIADLISYHKKQKLFATVTAVQPPSRYGVLALDEGNRVESFEEKPERDGGWINGGFFVLSPKVIDFIDDDYVMWEHAPMKRIVKAGQLSAFPHRGFWQPMDTLRDKIKLEEMWGTGNAPWKVWK
ncbi:MAG: glucose-1-phosphate cytidylyltransferase [Desulforhopalus sp.]